MNRPAIEVADIVRAKGRQFLERFKTTLSYQQLKAFRAVSRCRTAALGGHKDKCVGCEYEPPISFNSCRSRCCPKCQAQARRRWLEAQQRDLLTRNFLRSGTTVGTCVAGGSLHAGGGLGWQRAAWRAADMVPPRTRQRAGASEKQKGWWRSTQRLRAPVGIRWREPGLGARPDSEPCVFARTSPLPGPPMPVLSSAGDTRERLGSEPWL